MGPVYSWHFCQALLCHSLASSEDLAGIAEGINRDYFLQNRSEHDRAVDFATYTIVLTPIKYEIALNSFGNEQNEYRKIIRALYQNECPSFHLVSYSLKTLELLVW